MKMSCVQNSLALSPDGRGMKHDLPLGMIPWGTVGFDPEQKFDDAESGRSRCCEITGSVRL